MSEYLTNEELEVLTETLVESIKAESIKLGGLGKFDAQDLLEVHTILVDIIVHIENYATVIRTVPGEQKREVAIDVINELINIPVLPEFVEASIIGWIIDILVETFNKLGGQEWLNQLFVIEEDGTVRFLGR